MRSMQRFVTIMLLWITGSTLSHALDTSPSQVPVKLSNEKGSFDGQLSVSMTGSMNNAKVAWDARIVNTSSHKIFRVTFCVRSASAKGRLILNTSPIMYSTGDLAEYRRHELWRAIGLVNVALYERDRQDPIIPASVLTLDRLLDSWKWGLRAEQERDKKP